MNRGLNSAYRQRVVESEIRLRLASAGAVVLEGPKACGKTATAAMLAGSAVMLDVDEQARRAADVEPALVLAGKTPRLIDEWPRRGRRDGRAVNPGTPGLNTTQPSMPDHGTQFPDSNPRWGNWWPQAG